MLEVILPTLSVMGWLGLILGILVLINTVCGIIKNTSEGQKFSLKILGKGLLKAFVFYACAALMGVAFAMLPEANHMIVEVTGVQLFAQETLNTLSSVTVFAIVAAAVIAQGKNAVKAVSELLSVKISGDRDQDSKDTSIEK